MKLKEVRIKNFRCYKDEVSISFDDLTALVGRNDAGKSTIMDALDIFLNDGTPDKDDACKFGDPKDLTITCIFSDLPESVVLDQAATTSFDAEYLTNSQGMLEIQKTFNGELEKPKLIALCVNALHPTAQHVSDLIALNNSELKKRAQDLGIDTNDIDKKVNAQLRGAVRASVVELSLALVAVSLMEGNGSSVWKGIQATLPAFALFKSDRASTDQDPEAQDPLKSAIKEALKSKEAELNLITDHIQQEVKKIADLTLAKLREMDPSLASTLSPSFTKPNWSSLFKASITGDNNIPINKRGSGVRRLILLNFFRAKAQKVIAEQSKANVIMAIEEPETSQHPRNQRLLVSALTELASTDQVIITTHTPMLARVVPAASLRFVTERENGEKEIVIGGTEETNKMIASSLGVLPDHTVKVFIGVEGKTDIPFLKNISRVLAEAGENVPNLERLEIDGAIIFTPFGGSGLALWCNRLANLNRPEFHLYDRDTQPPAPPKYKQYIDEVNARPNCFATSTNKLEIENYLHVDAINEAIAHAGIAIQIAQQPGEFEDVPNLVKDELNTIAPQGNKWGETRVKEFLSSAAAARMTKERLDAIDPNGEVLAWMAKINEFLDQEQ
jgi:energy-coupling factor transporter ATP-binding protein EcfA2